MVMLVSFGEAISNAADAATLAANAIHLATNSNIDYQVKYLQGQAELHTQLSVAWTRIAEAIDWHDSGNYTLADAAAERASATAIEWPDATEVDGTCRRH